MPQFRDDSLVWLLCITYAIWACNAMTWVAWSPSPGNYLGISDELLSREQANNKCAEYGTVLPKRDVHVDFQSAEFADYMTQYCPNRTMAWTGDIDELFGSCKTVAVSSGSVYVGDCDCTADYYRYLCFGVPRSATTSLYETTEEIQSTTVALSTTPAVTTEAVTSADDDISTATTVALVTENAARTSTSQTTEPSRGNTTMSTFVNGVPPIANFSELSWNQWTPWSVCTSSCNGGQKLRLTLCAGKIECRYQLTSVSNITISYSIEWSRCNTEPCPIDGVWIAWQSWGDCSVTCAKGTRRRHRLCYGPLNGGEPCKGNQYDTEFCTVNSRCPAIIREEPPEEPFKESDSRPSAIGVGVVSLAFVLAELAIILCLDVFTILQQCHQRRRQERSQDKHVTESRHLRPTNSRSREINRSTSLNTSSESRLTDDVTY